MKQWHFFDKVYRVWVVLVISDAESFRTFLQDATYTEEFEDGASGALIHFDTTNTTNGNNCYVLWLKKYEAACLVHELSHLVMMVFDAKLVPVRTENTEAFAYYQEYWFNEVQRTRRKFPNGRTPLQVKKSS